MERWIDFKGANCYYNVYGKGKVIMLVHGFIEDGGMWDGIVNKLKKSYCLIVPDLPGFGKSPLTATELSMDWYAECLHEILKAEKVKNLVLASSFFAAAEFLRRRSANLSAVLTDVRDWTSSSALKILSVFGSNPRLTLLPTPLDERVFKNCT